MNRMCTVKLGLVAVALAVTVPAAASVDLAKKSNCTACHSVDKKMLGPSYKDVAARYAGKAGAEATLIEKVKKGGSGSWGKVPMPPNPKVSDADAKTLVTWILAQK